MTEGYRSTLEWGFWKFIKYLVTIGIISAITTWALTRLANLDIIVANWLIAVHLANLWLFIPETLISVGAVLIFRWGRKTEKRNRYKNYLKDLKGITETAEAEVKK